MDMKTTYQFFRCFFTGSDSDGNSKSGILARFFCQGKEMRIDISSEKRGFWHGRIGGPIIG
jgi:hypothetical protein